MLIQFDVTMPNEIIRNYKKSLGKISIWVNKIRLISINMTTEKQQNYRTLWEGRTETENKNKK